MFVIQGIKFSKIQVIEARIILGKLPPRARKETIINLASKELIEKMLQLAEVTKGYPWVVLLKHVANKEPFAKCICGEENVIVWDAIHNTHKNCNYGFKCDRHVEYISATRRTTLIKNVLKLTKN